MPHEMMDMNDSRYEIMSSNGGSGNGGYRA